MNRKISHQTFNDLVYYLSSNDKVVKTEIIKPKVNFNEQINELIIKVYSQYTKINYQEIFNQFNVHVAFWSKITTDYKGKKNIYEPGKNKYNPELEYCSIKIELVN